MLLAFLCLASSQVMAQYKWTWKDPLDLNIVDVGDNKLALYNGLGVGMVLTLTSFEEDIEYKWQNRTDYGVFVDYIRDYRHPPYAGSIAMRLRLNRYIRKFLKWGGDFVVYRIDDGLSSAVGFGTHLNVQWIIVNGNRWKLCYDNGVGPNLFETPFPLEGTRFNFTTYYGFHVSFRMKDQKWITLGFRNTHISNANIKGEDRNPSFDGFGITLGYEFTKR